MGGLQSFILLGSVKNNFCSARWTHLAVQAPIKVGRERYTNETEFTSSRSHFHSSPTLKTIRFRLHAFVRTSNLTGWRVAVLGLPGLPASRSTVGRSAMGPIDQDRVVNRAAGSVGRVSRQTFWCFGASKQAPPRPSTAVVRTTYEYAVGEVCCASYVCI